MRPGAKTAVTLSVLGTILAVGAAWGWSALTKPLPTDVAAPTCLATQISKGDRVFPRQVVVSVLNAGTREGLAGRTMRLFTDQGFTAGESANAPKGTDVATQEIWTDNPSSPAVRLVRTRLGKGTKVVLKDDVTQSGVVVVVGDGFDELGEGKATVKAREDSEICSPPAA